MKKNVLLLIGQLGLLFSVVVLYQCQIAPSQPSGSGNGGNAVETPVYHVSTTGHDTNDGTRVSPKRTVQSAIERALLNVLPARIHVAEGVYSTNYSETTNAVVALREGVSVYGGFCATNWDDRNPDQYVTLIRDDSTIPNPLGGANRAVDANSNITTNTVLDGLTIQGGNGDVSFAVFVRNGASPAIRNCRILSGTGNNSVAIYNVNGACPLIERNRITGGSGSTCYGIYNYLSSSPWITGNRIIAATAGLQSVAIHNDSNSSPRIENNVIDGGNGAYSTGIFATEYSRPVIRNNTINGGNNGSSYTIAVSFDRNSEPVVENNIIFNTAGSFLAGLVAFDGTAVPLSIRNNALSGCPSGYYYDLATARSVTLIADMNDTNQTTLDPSRPSSGNVADVPGLADIAGADGNINTPDDNDWRLTAATADAVKSGGLNGSHPAEQWGFSTDLAGNARSPLSGTETNGWSMGAYEY